MELLKTIEWIENAVRIVDQTRLPSELAYETVSTVEGMYWAIRELKVRGAPAIGVAAAFGLYLGVRDYPDDGDADEFSMHMRKVSEYLSSSRPTAVNLSWALHKMKNIAQKVVFFNPLQRVKQTLLEAAQEILETDRRTCRQIGEHGFEVLQEYGTLLTHCNAGGLAASELGTALAPVYVGLEKGKVFHVYAGETRPLLQGARITAFELNRAGVPVTLICDNMAAGVMAQGRIDAVIVGADRIASNGDFANKTGTYGLALVARAHNVPFYVAAPSNSFDLLLENGSQIPIEQRAAEEITVWNGRQVAPDGINVYNPAFDLTPHELVSAMITEKGVIRPPLGENIRALLKKS
jgi:methylthioribose-1-phosphate isomerase